MARCDLYIVLDRQEPIYRPGDTIAGTLEVTTSKVVKCNALEVSLDWFTHGRGNRDRGIHAQKIVFQGELPAGEHRFDFELDAPSDPRTYHGELLNIDFEVRATADIPWAIDPKTTQEIAIPRPEADFVVAPQTSESGNTSRIFPVAVLVALAGTIGVLFSREDGDTPCFGIGTFLLVAGLVGISLSVRKWLAQRKTGAVGVKLSQGGGAVYREVADPSKLRCEVLLEKRGARINGVNAVLEIRERVIRGSGTNKSTHYHPIYLDATKLERADSQRSVGRIQLPGRGDAPFPFHSASNHIDWFVEVHVDIEGWPDWKGNFDLAVTPGDQNQPG